MTCRARRHSRSLYGWQRSPRNRGSGEEATCPSRQVLIIVPFAPGGPAHLMARRLGGKLAQGWAQPVVVENRPGASANIGIGFAAKAASDGHTLLMSPSEIVVNPSLDRSCRGIRCWMPFPVTNTATAPNVVMTHPTLSATRPVRRSASSVRRVSAGQRTLAKARPAMSQFHYAIGNSRPGAVT